MADNTGRGRVVWHELVTPDVAASHDFYTQVFGWKTQDYAHDASYRMFAAASGPLGATVAEASAPPHWRHYISTADLDATLQQAQSLGASVVVEPQRLTDGSRYAVLTDPQGATFAIFSAAMPGTQKPAGPGEFSWLELATTDARTALEFYGALFGWERTADHDMGPMGFYYVFGHNGRELGGAFDKPAAMPGPPAWLGYVRVKHIEKVIRKAKAAGGTLINGPMDVPGGDRIAQLMDPHGVMFALHVLGTDLHHAVAAEPQPEVPATVEVTATSAAPAKKAARKAAKPKVAKKAVRRKVAKSKRPAAKSLQRSARKAVRVRSRTSKVRAKAAGRKKSVAKTIGKKTRARARKGK